MLVWVHWNIHRKCWSVLSKGRVIAHRSALCLVRCKFVVRPAGRQKAVEQGRRNVHAFVRGHLTENLITDAVSDRVRYQPFLSENFFRESTKQPIHDADTVWFKPDGSCWAETEIVPTTT